MEMKFCRRCGTKLQRKDPTLFTCENGHTIYLSPVPTVGILLINKSGKLMLSVRGEEPNKGKLDTFGGFLEPDETAEQGLVRELREELSLEPSEYETPKYLTSSVAHYNFGGEVKPLLCSLFWAQLLTDRQLETSDDVAGIKTFSLDDVDMSLLADQDTVDGVLALQKLASDKLL